MDQKMTLMELHKKQFDMMKQFEAFCKKHKLSYFLAYGTLIGAVRHNGFIPWDDDVDIIMPRPDYERLLNYNNISDEMVIVSYKKEQGYYHPFPYINICDTKTIMIEHQLKKQTGKGVFLDVFPLDGCPKNKIIRGIRIIKLKILSKAYHLKIIPNLLGSQNGIRIVIEKIIFFFFKKTNEYDLVDRIIKIATKTKYEEGEMVWVGVFLGRDASKSTFSKNSFREHIKHQFEGAELCIPVGYDDCLRRSYGNYMEPPKVEDQFGHHEIDYLWKICE